MGACLPRAGDGREPRDLRAGRGLRAAPGYRAVITALIVTQSSVGGSLKAALDRFLISAPGACYGGAAAFAIPHHGGASTIAALSVAVAPLAFDRILEIGLGSVVGLAPRRAGPAACAVTGEAARSAAARLRDLVEALSGGHRPASDDAALAAAVAGYREAIDGMRRRQVTRTLSTDGVGRIFWLAFSLERLRRNLDDLAERARDFSGRRRAARRERPAHAWSARRTASAAQATRSAASTRRARRPAR